jgi:hypothetical protein
VVPGGISLEGKPKRRSSWFCSCELEKKGKRVKKRKEKKRNTYSIVCTRCTSLKKRVSSMNTYPVLPHTSISVPVSPPTI